MLSPADLRCRAPSRRESRGDVPARGLDGEAEGDRDGQAGGPGGDADDGRLRLRDRVRHGGPRPPDAGVDDLRRDQRDPARHHRAHVRPVSAASEAARTVRVLTRSGALRFPGPLPFVRGLVAARRWGRGLGGAVAANAAREPPRICLIDELGPVTHAELHDRSSRLAAALAARAVRPGSAVGLLCRDHRFFIEAAVATNKAGADLLLLNTSFSGPQLREVLEREGARAVVYDEEFAELVAPVRDDVVRIVGWHDGPAEDSIDALVAGASAADATPPAEL